MKNVFEIGFKVLVVATLVVVIALQLNHRQDVVYVDSIQLMAKYKGMATLTKTLEQKSRMWQANLDTLRLEMEKATTDLERNKHSAPAGELKLMQELVVVKQRQYVSYEENAKAQYQKAEQELSVKLFEKVNDYLKRYGEQKGYAIILAATHYGNIAYAQKEKDITMEVLAGLNAEYEKVK